MVALMPSLRNSLQGGGSRNGGGELAARQKERWHSCGCGCENKENETTMQRHSTYRPPGASASYCGWKYSPETASSTMSYPPSWGAPDAASACNSWP